MNFGSSLFGKPLSASTPAPPITTTIVANPESEEAEKQPTTISDPPKASNVTNNDSEFLANLNKLNETFFEHIKSYIDRSM